MHDYKSDVRFNGIESFEHKLQLSSPAMHGDEKRRVDDAIPSRTMKILS